MNNIVERCVTISIFATIGVLMWGCTKPLIEEAKAPTVAEKTLPLHDIAEDAPPATDAWQQDTHGTVIEVFPNAINLKTEAHPDGIVLATSGDVKVYNGDGELKLSSVQPGDRITAVRERRGNPGDGWQSLVVQINLAPSSRQATTAQ